jgi:hypothetical protein
MKNRLQRLDEMCKVLSDGSISVEQKFKLLEGFNRELDFIEEINRYRREVLTTKKYLMN